MSSQNSPHGVSTASEHLKLVLTPSSPSNQFLRANQLLQDYKQGSEISLYATTLPNSPKSLDFRDYQDAMDDKDDRGYTGLGRIRRCHAKNPIPEDANPVGTVTLEGIIGGGSIRGQVTHVWTAHFGPDGQKVVAKFFDPLYYREDFKGLNPFNLVDRLVNNEWNAYQRLEVLQGSTVPRVIGIYLAAFPAPDLADIPDEDIAAILGTDLGGLRDWHFRNVYVLLMEFVDGTIMSWVDPIKSEPEVRDRIMDMVIGAEKRVLSLGVKHEDFRAQNVVLQVDVEKVVNNVVLLDYEDSKLTDINSKEWDASEDAHKARVARTRASEDFLDSYSQFGLSWLGKCPLQT